MSLFPIISFQIFQVFKKWGDKNIKINKSSNRIHDHEIKTQNIEILNQNMYYNFNTLLRSLNRVLNTFKNLGDKGRHSFKASLLFFKNIIFDINKKEKM